MPASRDSESNGSRHRRGWRIAVFAALYLVLAAGLAMVTYPSNVYSISARTSVLTVEPSCGRKFVWDLPHGSFVSTSADVPPPLEEDAKPAPALSGYASVQLASGARARIERVEGGALAILFDHSPNFKHCATSEALVELRLNGSDSRAESVVLRLGRVKGDVDRIVFRGTDVPEDGEKKVEAHAQFVLLIEGRIVAGAEMQQGSGWHGGQPASMLESALVSIRSREGITGQSVDFVEQSVDAGSLVDTMPCFGHGLGWFEWLRVLWQQPGLLLSPRADAAQACTLAVEKPAQGFVQPHREGGMHAQMHVAAQRIGITAHQGEPRMLGVPLWQVLKHSLVAQALAVIFLVVSQAHSFFEAVASLAERLFKRSGRRD